MPRVGHSPVKTPLGCQDDVERVGRRLSPLELAKERADRLRAEEVIARREAEEAAEEARRLKNEEVARLKAEEAEARREAELEALEAARRLQNEEAARQKVLQPVLNKSSQGTNPKRKRGNDDELLDELVYNEGQEGQASTEGAAMDILFYCDKLSSTKKASIIDKLNLMTSVIARQANEIAYLRGLIDGRASVVAEAGETSDLSHSDKKSNNSKSFADITKNKVSTKVSAIIIRPEVDEQGKPAMASEDTRKAVTAALDLRKDNIKILKIRPGREGAIIVEAADKRSAVKIMGSEAISSAGLTAQRPVGRKPKILLYDMPTERDFVEEAVLDIFYQNVSGMELEEFKGGFNIVKMLRSSNEDKANWVVELSAPCFKALSGKDRLFVGFEACKMKEFSEATRCYRCQGYGHVAKHCSMESPTCGHCAADHDYKNCPNRNRNPICAPCKRAKRPHDHNVTSNVCPAYIRALEINRNRIDYGN